MVRSIAQRRYHSKGLGHHLNQYLVTSRVSIFPFSTLCQMIYLPGRGKDASIQAEVDSVHRRQTYCTYHTKQCIQCRIHCCHFRRNAGILIFKCYECIFRLYPPRITAMLTIAMMCMAVEFAGLFAGHTVVHQKRANIVSALAHLGGFLTTLSMVLNGWTVRVYPYVFVLCRYARARPLEAGTKEM